MPDASEQLSLLINQAKQLRLLIEMQPSAKEIEDLPDELEREIETEDGGSAWFNRRGVKLAISDISSRVDDVLSGLDEMLSSVIEQTYGLFIEYQQIAKLEQDPPGEYEQSLRELSYDDWKEILDLGDAKRVVSLAMSRWTPQQAERIGWIEPVTALLNPQTASYVVSRALYESHTEIPSWWDLLSPMLVVAQKKGGDLNGCLNSWVNRHAMNDRGSNSGWPASTWIKKLKECGATVNPRHADFTRMFSQHDVPMARLASIQSHHEMMRGRLERLFATDSEKFREAFSLFCPRVSSSGKGSISTPSVGQAKNEREALEEVLELARKSIHHVSRDKMDGHVLSDIFEGMDRALALMLSDQSLPSYAAMFHELRSNLEVRDRAQNVAPPYRAM